MNLFEYIKNYSKVHGIKNYSLKSKVLTKADFANTHSFAPGIAFFYRLSVCGEIDDVNNINSKFLTINTPTEFFDMSKIVDIVDNVTLQHAESNFIFVSDNMLTLELSEGANCLFSKIFNAKLFYMYLTVLPESDEPEHAINVHVKQTY